jgi:predicted GNAT family N-acyltransferase
MASGLVFRYATSEASLRSIFRLRYQVYVEEQGRYYGAADHDQRLFFDPDDMTASRHLLIENIDGQVVAAVRTHLVPSQEKFSALNWSRLVVDYGDKGYFISRFVVEKDFRFTRCVALLVQGLASDCALIGGRFVVTHSSPRYVPFYKKIGFEVFGHPFEEPDAGAQIPLLMGYPIGGRLLAGRHKGTFLGAAALPE